MFEAICFSNSLGAEERMGAGLQEKLINNKLVIHWGPLVPKSIHRILDRANPHTMGWKTGLGLGGQVPRPSCEDIQVSWGT